VRRLIGARGRERRARNGKEDREVRSELGQRRSADSGRMVGDGADGARVRALTNVIVPAQRDRNEQQGGEEKDTRPVTEAMLQSCHQGRL
jgi:hypothetical protein